MIDKKNIGNKLVLLRGNRSQKEVAKAIDVTVAALSNYENGLRIPKDEIKKKISKFYKVSVEKIFFED